jgi:hypothetical protein
LPFPLQHGIGPAEINPVIFGRPDYTVKMCFGQKDPGYILIIEQSFREDKRQVLDRVDEMLNINEEE